MSARKYNVSVHEIISRTEYPPENMDLKAHCCISLSNPSYYGKRLRALLLYLKNNFSEVMLVLSGYLYRYNFSITHGCDPESALQQALLTQKNYVLDELNQCEDILKSDNIIVREWGDLSHTPEFDSSTHHLTKLYQNDPIFKEKIITSAEKFLSESRYLHAHNTEVKNFNTPKNREHCINFLLEESAMFDYLVRMDYTIGVYPGEMLPAMNDIINGEHLTAPVGLKKRINLQLKIQRCGRKRETCLKNSAFDISLKQDKTNEISA